MHTLTALWGEVGLAELAACVHAQEPTAFARMGVKQQQAQMAVDILYGVVVVRKKLQAKGSVYDGDVWQHDVQMILNLWQQAA